MIKAGKNSIGIVRLKLCVYVLLGVNIDKANTATSIIVVATLVVDANCILSNLEFACLQVEESSFEFDVSVLAILKKSCDFLSFEVHNKLLGHFR